MKTTLDMAIIRYAVACKKWQEVGGSIPVLGVFLCGWFMRDMGIKIDIDHSLRDSYNQGWHEADAMINIKND